MHQLRLGRAAYRRIARLQHAIIIKGNLDPIFQICESTLLQWGAESYISRSGLCYTIGTRGRTVKRYLPIKSMEEERCTCQAILSRLRVSRSVLLPSLALASAASQPACPAPTMTTSYSSSASKDAVWQAALDTFRSQRRLCLFNRGDCKK